MKFCYFPPERWTVCCCTPLQWRGTSWNCRNAIYWEGLKWAMSGRQASAALIVSVPLIHSGRAAVHFYRQRLPSSPKPRTNTAFIFRHNGALPTRHEIAFHYKSSSDMKESTQSEAIWMWSKIDLEYTLIAEDTSRRRCDYSMTQHLSPPLDYVVFSGRTWIHISVSHARIKKLRWPLKLRK